MALLLLYLILFLKFEETFATQDSNLGPRDLVLLIGLEEDSIYIAFLLFQLN